LRALGAYTSDRASHTPFILIGNNRTGQWRRIYGLMPAEKIVEEIRSISGAAERAYFTDLPLVDQQGRTVRFYTDVLEGKIVVVNFMFTRCTGICPILSSTMQKVQQSLSGHVGDEVRLVSISVDPEHDTSAALGEFARRFEAGAGWLFLTGEKENVDRVSHKLGGYTEQKEAHLPLFLVGDVVTGRWTKVVGAGAPERITEAVNGLLDARNQRSSAHVDGAPS
jgi:protein SCO1